MFHRESFCLRNGKKKNGYCACECASVRMCVWVDMWPHSSKAEDNRQLQWGSNFPRAKHRKGNKTKKWYFLHKRVTVEEWSFKYVRWCKRCVSHVRAGYRRVVGGCHSRDSVGNGGGCEEKTCEVMGERWSVSVVGGSVLRSCFRPARGRAAPERWWRRSPL